MGVSIPSLGRVDESFAIRRGGGRRFASPMVL